MLRIYTSRSPRSRLSFTRLETYDRVTFSDDKETSAQRDDDETHTINCDVYTIFFRLIHFLKSVSCVVTTDDVNRMNAIHVRTTLDVISYVCVRYIGIDSCCGAGYGESSKFHRGSFTRGE
jgi:hypothetical protein